ncbi:MAG: SCPU domain-containing protein [Gammaproteobacteria bacterium]|nr:MAG: SCPU domain-containing protein [Gammaproteobacteria bacterium]
MKQQLIRLLVLFFLYCTNAFAINDQTLNANSTQVKMEIVNGCTLNNVSSGVAAIGTLNFGDIYNLNSQRDANTSSGNGNIELHCTPGTTAKITMNAGLYGSNVNDRKMRLNSGAATLIYQVYTSSTRQTVWDDTVGVSVAFNSDVTQSIPIYGRVPVQTTPLSGAYSDQILVTVAY